MYVVVRKYSGSGASELFDLIEQRSDEVKEVISGTPGFVSYVGFREGDGGTTVTVCEDAAGTEESSKRAADWVSENATSPVEPPSIAEGSALIQF